MAKRKKPSAKEETPDEILSRWHSELLERIRPYLIEFPADLDDDALHVVLSTEGQTYCVTSELLESKGEEAIEVWRAASAIELIDIVREGGDPVTDLCAKVELGIRFAELRLEHLAVEGKGRIDARDTGLKLAQEARAKKVAEQRNLAMIWMDKFTADNCSQRDAIGKTIDECTAVMKDVPSASAIRVWHNEHKKQCAAR